MIDNYSCTIPPSDARGFFNHPRYGQPLPSAPFFSFPAPLAQALLTSITAAAPLLTASQSQSGLLAPKLAQKQRFPFVQ